MIKKHHHARCCYCSVIISDSLGPHGLQHTRLLCLHYSQSLLKFMSTELVMLFNNNLFLYLPFLFFLHSFAASESFPKSRLFTPGGQSTGASASASAKSTNHFLLELTGLNSLQCKRLSGVFCSTTFQKHQSLGTEPSLWTNSHIRTWLLKKTISFFFF